MVRSESFSGAALRLMTSQKSHQCAHLGAPKAMTCILSSRPSVGARINDINCESLIREGSENDAFHFPRSKKPLTDFLRQ